MARELKSKARVEVEGEGGVEEKTMGEAHSSVRLGLETSTKLGVVAHSSVGLRLLTSTV